MNIKELAQQNLPNCRKEWIWFGIILLVVIVLLLIGLNKYLAISYKAVLIQAPCNLCEEYQRVSRTIYPINLSDLNLSP